MGLFNRGTRTKHDQLPFDDEPLGSDGNGSTPERAPEEEADFRRFFEPGTFDEARDSEEAEVETEAVDEPEADFKEPEADAEEPDADFKEPEADAEEPDAEVE